MEIHGVTITHPEKVLYPELGITKAVIVGYYNFIAGYMLPYIKNRPISLRHFPEGIDNPGFYHKHAAKFYPDYIQRFSIPTHSSKIDMIGIANAEGLIYVAGQNSIELHMSLSTIKNIRKPDQIILDLDPSDNDFEKVRILALRAKEIIENTGLQCFVKTSGSRGLHVHIPLKPMQDFSVIKPITKELAANIVAVCPDIATIELRKNKRGNKVFIDYLRNEYAATAIAPYSLRANKWAGIATPLDWEEVKHDKTLTAYKYNIQNIHQRVTKQANPWAEFK